MGKLLFLFVYGMTMVFLLKRVYENYQFDYEKYKQNFRMIIVLHPNLFQNRGKFRLFLTFLDIVKWVQQD